MNEPFDPIQALNRLLDQNRLVEAGSLCRQIEKAPPSTPETWLLLASAYARAGDLEAVCRCCERALALDPRQVSAAYNLGVAAQGLGDWQRARGAYERALRHAPAHAGSLNNLTLVYRELGLTGQAVDTARRAVAVSRDARTLSNLGLALKDAGSLEEALACLDEAIAQAPRAAEGHYNRGLVLNLMDRPGEAEEGFRRALALNPRYKDAWNDLGVALQAQNRLPEALEAYDEAIALDGAFVKAQWNRALLLLLMGDFRRGWAAYEWRWKRPETPRPAYEVPRWEGEPLKGRTILLAAEQGNGDTLQFVRFAARVRALGARVLLDVPPPLRTLLEGTPGVDAIVRDEPADQDADFWCPLMSLPQRLGISLHDLPDGEAYVHPRGEPGAGLLQLLGEKGDRQRIGLVWAGNPQHHNDRNRSIPLERFRDLLALDNFHWFSLQVGPRSKDIERLGWRNRLIDLSPQLHDYNDTAWALAHLDLLISVDTSVAHLAGAMARPAWVLLPHAPDWRWLLDREDSPWYPSLRLFRQPRIGDWGSALAEMKEKMMTL